MGLSVFDLLLPREIKFFRYMNRQTDILYEASKAFSHLALNIQDMSPDDIKNMVLRIKDYESQGDRIERFIIDQLNKTFITPIDREDIHSIVTHTDNSLDILNDIAKKIVVYKIRRVPPNVCQFSRIIVDISVELKRLIRCLKNKNDVKSIINNIHHLENEADNLFHASMAELFDNGDNTIYLIKFKEIYEHLEDVVNSVEFVASLVRGVAVKQG